MKFEMEYVNVIDYVAIDKGIIMVSMDYKNAGVTLTKIQNHKVMGKLCLKGDFKHCSNVSLQASKLHILCHGKNDISLYTVDAGSLK